MSLYERRDVTVLGAADEVAFPMSGNRAILDFCGSFSNRNGVDDLAAVRFAANGKSLLTQCVTRGGKFRISPCFFSYT